MDSRSLVESFCTGHQLSLRWEERYAVITGQDDADRVRIILEPDRTTLDTDEWHGHYDTTEEALQGLELILLGSWQTVEIFRQDRLASTFLIGPWDEDGYLTSHRALFLNPFDREEWLVHAGAPWRWVYRKRVWLGSNPQPLVVTEDLRDDSFPPEQLFGELKRRLGPPRRGHRWIMVEVSFAVQMPTGWLTKKEKSVDLLSVHYVSPSQDASICITLSFQESQSPSNRSPSRCPPLSVAEHFDKASPNAGQIRALFDNGAQQMLAEFDFAVDAGSQISFSRLRRMVKSIVSRSAMVRGGP